MIVWELTLALFPDCSFTQSICAGGKDVAVEVTGEGNVCGNHYSVSSDSTVVFTAATLHTKNEKKKKSENWNFTWWYMHSIRRY